MDKANNPTFSSFLGVVVIVVYALYLTSVIKTVPCSNDVMSRFYSNFVHVDAQHLISNLYSLYALSRVEKTMGTGLFASLVVFSLLCNTILESIAHKIFPEIPCSIGFSGIIFSILTWELVAKKKIDFYLVFSIVGMVIFPSLRNNKASLLGHAVGAFTGIIAGVLWNTIIEKKFSAEKY